MCLEKEEWLIEGKGEMVGREGKHNRVSLLRTMYFPQKKGEKGGKGGEKQQKSALYQKMSYDKWIKSGGKRKGGN